MLKFALFFSKFINSFRELKLYSFVNEINFIYGDWTL